MKTQIDRKESYIYKHRKIQQTILERIFSTTSFVILALVIEVLFIILSYQNILNYIYELMALVVIVDIVAALGIHSASQASSSKATWLTVVYFLPILGALVYLYAHYDWMNYRFKKRYREVYALSKDCIKEDEVTVKEVKGKSNGLYLLHEYLKQTGNNGIYQNCDAVYFKSGEEQMPVMIEELKKAEKFIFLDYYIISEGKVWGEILEILLDKVSSGVDVRVVYDGTCDFKYLPRNYYRLLNQAGIKCVKFAPVYPIISPYLNFRDHHKIAVIDGMVGFVGGTNLSDEYANIITRFGYWKDTAVMIKGQAVESLTLMFLQVFSNGKPIEDYDLINIKAKSYPEPGYIIPFHDIPFDEYHVGETVYMDMINHAHDSIYIMTPYFVTEEYIDGALILAAKKGVEVNLILPGIPDKIITNSFARARYKKLVSNGVHIYEFKEGFTHAKQVCVDGRKAVVGSINFDYRSFNHNFEAAIYMENTTCIKDIERDMIEYCQNGKEITQETIKKIKLRQRLLARLFKVFEPLF